MATLIERHCADVDDQAQALEGFVQRYEQLGRGRFLGSVWQVMMAQGHLLRESTNRQLRELVVTPADHIAIALPLQVQAGSMFAGRVLDSNSLIVLGGTQEHELSLAGTVDLIGMCLHRDLLQTLAPAKAEWLGRAECARNLSLTPDAAAAIRQVLSSVQTQATRSVEALSGEATEHALLTATLTQTVLLAMSGDDGATHIPRRAETRARVVRRAIEFMRERLHDDIGIAEICAAACASRRSLQYCFEELMQTSPQAYLRALRLNEARRMLKFGTDTPVTTIANELGFSSASHFTSHYKLMFDELPSATLRSREASISALRR